MSKCYVCDLEITKALETDEHIILNACGGRLKSKKLICSKCNSEYGGDTDAELARQLNFFSNFINVKRDRGKSQPVEGELTTTGEKYSLYPGGKPIISKPVFEERIEGEKTKIAIAARNKKEFQKILNGLNKKYPQLDVEKALKHAKLEKKYLKNQLSFESTIGGEKAFRSACKTAVNFYIYSNGDSKYIKHLISYLKGTKDLEVVWFYYPNPPLHNLEEKEVSHLLFLKGDNKEKKLYCYIEFFNVYCFLVKLNDNYLGKDIENKYCYDLIRQNELEKGIKFKLTNHELTEAFINKDIPYTFQAQKIERFLNIALKKQSSEHIGELIDLSLKNSLMKYPEGTIITHEMINELVAELMKQITPFLFCKLRYKGEFK